MSDSPSADLLRELAAQFEQWSLSPAAGRILAALTLTERNAMSAAELALVLGMSRGAISSQTRMLTEMGMVKRVRPTGTRTLQFQLHDDFLEEVLTRRQEHIREIRALAIRAAASTPDNPRTERLRRFYRHWERSLRSLMAEWRAQHPVALDDAP